MCNIQFVWIAVLKIRICLYVRFIHVWGNTWGSDGVLIYNPLSVCVVKRVTGSHCLCLCWGVWWAFWLYHRHQWAQEIFWYVCGALEAWL